MAQPQSAEDHPRRVPGWAIERTDHPSIFQCVEPGGRSVLMRKADAAVASACDGTSTIEQIRDAANQYQDSPLTVDMVAAVVRRLRQLGIVEPSANPLHNAGPPERPPPLRTTSKPVLRAVPPPAPTDDPQGGVIETTNMAPADRDKVAAQLSALSSLSLDKVDAPPMPTVRSGGVPWWVLIVAALGAGGYFAWHHLPHDTTQPGGDTNPAAPQFRIEEVRAESHAGQVLMAAGYLSTPRLMSLGATLGGRIEKILVKPNDKVKKNQIVIQLDDGEARAEALLAQAKLSDAVRNWRRQKTLLKAEATTQTDVDKATGQVEIARAEVAVARQKIEQSKVRAPINSTVIEIPVHEGEVIKGDSTAGALIKLADLTEIIAEADVNEADVPLVRMGQSADVTTDATAGKVFSGKVIEISQQVDRARGTVLVKVRLDHPEDMLRPGMSVKVAFRQDANAPPRLLLPRSAILEGRVWVVEGGKAHPRPVSYESVGPSTVEITNGLKAGERVVVDGASRLTDGQRVE